MWQFFKKEHPKDRLCISNLLPKPVKRATKLCFGIGEWIITTIVSLFSTTASVGGLLEPVPR